MKLSDIKGERVFDVIAEIVVPVANIAADHEAAKLFKRENLPEGANRNEYAMNRLKNGLPTLLKEHKEDIISILSTIEGISYEEYAENLTLVKLLTDVSDLVTDGAVGDLFMSAQTQQSSGSALESTKASNQ